MPSITQRDAISASIGEAIQLVTPMLSVRKASFGGARRVCQCVIGKDRFGEAGAIKSEDQAPRWRWGAGVVAGLIARRRHRLQ